MRSACAAKGGLVVAQAPDFPILYANPAYCRLSGYALSELVGCSAALMRNKEQHRKRPAILAAALSDGREQRLLLRSPQRDDSEFWNQLTVAPVPAPDGGKPVQLLCVSQDVSEQHLQKAQLRQLISHDQHREVKGRAAVRGDTLAVICLSLVSLRLVNDSLGHGASDEFVVTVSRRLGKCLGPHDTLARHGGNEFVLVLGEIASGADVTRACTHLLRALAVPVDVAGQRWNVPCSMRIARYPQDADDGIELLRYADLALAHARDLGGNGYRFFTPDMNQRNAERIQMESFTAPFDALTRCGDVNFNIVISDVQMPQMTGIEFLHALKEVAPTTVRMILSASTKFQSVASAISEAQVFRYIPKPWQVNDLQENIRLALIHRDELLAQERMTDELRLQAGQMSVQEREAKLLAEDEPGLLKVKWGPNGEIIL